MAFPFPMAMAIHECLANLSEDEEDEFIESATDDPEELQEHESTAQEEMIERFKKMRAQFVGPGGMYADPMLAGMMGSGLAHALTLDDTKPQSATKSLVALKPMLVKELVLCTTHRGHYLCGWIAIDDASFGISSSSLLLEDVTGHLVELAVYGLADMDLPPMQRQRALASRFPKGKPIVVFEPYYKVRMDSSLGIRIDDAQELVEWREVPTDLMSWKKLGNEYYNALDVQNKGSGALACYQRALEVVQPEVRTIAVLLNNIATCRFKVGDYVTSIQLSGVAAHLNPTYFKAWFRLASALAEYDIRSQKEGKVCRPSVVARVVAHARSVLPHLSPQEQQMLENTLSTSDTFTTPDNLAQFRSYAEWCAVMGSLEFVLAEDNVTGSEKSADAWRREGSINFAKGDLGAAENCYRKGLAVTGACLRDVSIVLNNIAAVHLTLYKENCDVPGISVTSVDGSSSNFDNVMPDTEVAFLNCTVAGMLDPLNHKAWSRRTRCLENLLYSPEECTADLQAIQSSILPKEMVLTQTSERVQAFKKSVSDDIQRYSHQALETKAAYNVSDVPTNVQREERDGMRPEHFIRSRNMNSSEEKLFCGEGDTNIDSYIAQLESLDAMTRFAFASSKKKPRCQQQPIPREMVMYLENAPPQIHIEFPKERGWPTGIDSVFARKVLYRAFLDARCNPCMKASSMRMEMFYENMNPADVIKRWHGGAALKIIQNKGASLRYGDIVDGREALSEFLPAYDARIRSNFANNPSRSEVYFYGTTHIAIGFNDLSSLLSATLRGELHNVEPLRFVGFEMSEFAVAKCKVIAQMLGSPSVSISSVMEVWLSSTWSETTLKDFRQSVSFVLESLRGQNENVKVLSYLRHWASTGTISAAKARSEFFLNAERYNQKCFSAICCFHREIDRLDLVQYLLTGEVHATPTVMNLVEQELDAQNEGTEVCKEETGKSESKKARKCRKKKRAKKSATKFTEIPQVGNIAMWNVPSGAPPLEEDVAINIVDFMSLVEDFAKREKKQKGSAARLSVVGLFVIHILHNLQRLRELMVTNKLTIEVHYGVVKAVRGAEVNDPENQKLLNRIAMMRPYTISWSNVLDYFMPEDFHDLARRCSIYGDCMHYGYSMNWTTQVFGASIIDYDPKDCKQLIDGILDIALGFPSSFESSSMMSAFKAAGIDKLVTFPLRENPFNSTGYLLAGVNKQNWINHFMNAGNLTPKAKNRLGMLCTAVNCGLQKGSMELALPSPLYRTSLTLYMSWCYDPNLRLQAANNPFEMSAATDEYMLAHIMQELSTEEKGKIWNDTKFNFNA